MKIKFSEILGKELLFFDGAFGSMLQNYEAVKDISPANINITNPEIIIELHLKYIESGCRIITANTFGALSNKVTNIEEIIEAATKNAREAVRISGREDIFIAFDMGSTGLLIEPMGVSSFEEVYSIFSKSATLAQKYGADFVLIETMIDLYEAKAAVLAFKENTDLPVICSVTYEKNGRNLTGGDVLTAVSVLEGLGVDAIGINCGVGPAETMGLAKKLIGHSSVPVLVQPNAGLPEMVDGHAVYKQSALDFAEKMAEICKMGAWLLGGCCGTTPEHIGEMIKLCKGITPPPVFDRGLTMASSGRETVIFEGKPIIIGERINPTNRTDLQDALKKGDYDFLADEAMEQIEAGADLIDININTFGIDESKAMTEAIKAVQTMGFAPISIDSQNAEVLEAALRIYNGKAVINSLNGTKESMDTVFPLVKKYGGVVVGLALDENGIPKTAEERLVVAEKIVSTAEKYGIPKKNILIDTLVLAACFDSGDDIILETVKAIGLVKRKLGVKTVLGISNVSYGMKDRGSVNGAFLSAALYEGLDAAILNPLSEDIKKTLAAWETLRGRM